MLRIHQPYIKSNKFRKTFAFASIGVLLLGSLIIVNSFSESNEVSAAEIKYMQQFTNPICQSMNTGGTMDLIDPRGESEADFQTYKIIKMGDGTCWMAENLRLMDTTIDGTNSDMTPQTAENTFTIPASNISGFTTSDQYQPKTYYNNDTTYGAYYNWYTATAGTGTSSINGTTGKDIASSSICPKGWKLPAYEGTGSFYNIISGTNGYKSAWLTGSTAINSKNGYKFGYDSNSAFWPAAGNIGSDSLNNAGSNGFYWSRRAYDSSDAYYLYFGNPNVYPQRNANRYYGRSVRCVADPEYTGNITWSEDKTENVNVNIPSILTIDAASGLAETADASKIIEGTATATISSNTEYNVTLHSTQPSLKDPTVTTAEISPVSDTNPVQPGNNSWGFWNGTGSADTKSYTLPITATPQSFPNTTTATTNTTGDPATLHTYYVGISISPSLPSGTYATDVIITASVK